MGIGASCGRGQRAPVSRSHRWPCEPPPEEPCLSGAGVNNRKLMFAWCWSAAFDPGGVNGRCSLSSVHFPCDPMDRPCCLVSPTARCILFPFHSRSAEVCIQVLLEGLFSFYPTIPRGHSLLLRRQNPPCLVPCQKQYSTYTGNILLSALALLFGGLGAVSL